MEILITGITGLFGSQLAKEFSQVGSIHGLKRKDSKLDLLDPSLEIIWHEGSIGDLDSILEALQGIDLVIHAAGLVSFSSRDQVALDQVNTQGTKNLVNAMLASGVTKLVHVSSVAAIGRMPGIQSLDENFIWTDSPLNTDYAISKYRAELEVWRGQQEGLEVLVVNPSIILGKVSWKRSSTEILDYVMNENRFYPLGNLNYIDVRDAAKITRLLVEKETWGERYILNKESIPYRDFFETAGKVFSKKAPSIPVSSSLVKIVAPLMGILRMLGLGKSTLNRQTAMISQQKTEFNNQKVNAALNYTYLTLEESLEWAKS
ncbi:NAD-dependent epimerase/dehydratase family protein [Algoriphagus mannitolivorans]|uniref:NAD-dependent epimerase/dehydratase family protein n=1 Tax=Algoriphagus mannitolivorans TaxID=226504 RepID=UPI00041BF3F1|nr:NAD-dependent epimerase/dehydratase family protein [Algoriphagus mannitolivorans]